MNHPQASNSLLPLSSSSLMIEEQKMHFGRGSSSSSSSTKNRRRTRQTKKNKSKNKNKNKKLNDMILECYNRSSGSGGSDGIIATDIIQKSVSDDNDNIQRVPKHNFMPSLSLFSVPTIDTKDHQSFSSAAPPATPPSTNTSSTMMLTTNANTAIFDILEEENEAGSIYNYDMWSLPPLDVETAIISPSVLQKKSLSVGGMNKNIIESSASSPSPTSVMNTLDWDQQQDIKAAFGYDLPFTSLEDDDEEDDDDAFDIMEEDEEADYDTTDAPINPLLDAVVNNALNYIENDDDDEYHHQNDDHHSLAITDDDDATINIVNLGDDTMIVDDFLLAELTVPKSKNAKKKEKNVSKAKKTTVKKNKKGMSKTKKPTVKKNKKVMIETKKPTVNKKNKKVIIETKTPTTMTIETNKNKNATTNINISNAIAAVVEHKSDVLAQCILRSSITRKALETMREAAAAASDAAHQHKTAMTKSKSKSKSKSFKDMNGTNSWSLTYQKMMQYHHHQKKKYTTTAAADNNAGSSVVIPSSLLEWKERQQAHYHGRIDANATTVHGAMTLDRIIGLERVQGWSW